jgi:hypothetical protein
VLDPAVKPLAYFDDGSPAAYEHSYGRGSVIIAGSFPRQANETPEAIARQRANIVVGNLPGDRAANGRHPLGGFLAEWAGVSLPDFKTSALIDLQQPIAPSGRMVFLVNWGTQPAKLELTLPPGRPPRQVRELTRGQVLAAGDPLRIQAEVPGRGVLVYRIDYGSG